MAFTSTASQPKGLVVATCDSVLRKIQRFCVMTHWDVCQEQGSEGWR